MQSTSHLHFIYTAFCIVLLFFICTTANADTIWIDVRSVIEHKIDNIEGDSRVPYRDAVSLISKMHPNKDTPIRLYCYSGVRANKAMLALEAAGYTNISNAGGISDARKERGLSQ